MQGSLVQVSVNGRRKENNGCSLAGGYPQIHGGKLRLSALGAIVPVEIRQDGHDPLTTVLGKPPSIYVAQVKCVKVLWCDVGSKKK